MIFRNLKRAMLFDVLHTRLLVASCSAYMASSLWKSKSLLVAAYPMALPLQDTPRSRIKHSGPFNEANLGSRGEKEELLVSNSTQINSKGPKALRTVPAEGLIPLKEALLKSGSSESDSEAEAAHEDEVQTDRTLASVEEGNAQVRSHQNLSFRVGRMAGLCEFDLQRSAGVHLVSVEYTLNKPR